MPSESLAVCQALAAMFHVGGEPSTEEIAFVAHAALDLGLNDNEQAELQETLRNGGHYIEFIGHVSSRKMRAYLFRRVVAAALLDEQINETEQAFINKTAAAFGYASERIADVTSWMLEGIAWEKRGAQLLGNL